MKAVFDPLAQIHLISPTGRLSQSPAEPHHWRDLDQPACLTIDVCRTTEGEHHERREHPVASWTKSGRLLAQSHHRDRLCFRSELFLPEFTKYVVDRCLESQLCGGVLVGTP